MADLQRLAMRAELEERADTYMTLRLAPHAALYGVGPAKTVKACYRTPRSSQACAICGVRSRQMHMPTGRLGHFCALCCPECANHE